MNPCKVVAPLPTSQPLSIVLTLTDITHLDVLGPSHIRRKEPELHVCTSHLWHCPLLHGSGATYPGLVVLSGESYYS